MGHFTRTKENRDKCIYHYFNKEFCCSTKLETTNFLKHLSVCKHIKTLSEGQSSYQPAISEEGKLKAAMISEHTFREATNEIMVIGELPLCFVEGVAWKQFCTKVRFLLYYLSKT